MRIDEKKLLDFIENNNTKPFKVTGVIDCLHERTILIHSDKKYEMLTESENNVISNLTKAELDYIRIEMNLRKYERIWNV